jgi:outer membrane receptor protein involved in Fe transport
LLRFPPKSRADATRLCTIETFWCITTESGGAFAIGDGRWRTLGLRAGGRLGLAAADAPGDAPSATTAVDRRWLTRAGFATLSWRRGGLELSTTVDRSFRAPNLDDLTGRQAAGPGFQFENAALAPERATTLEVGARVVTASVRAEAWAYVARVDGAIARSLRSIDDCPPTSRDCQGAWFRYQLVNLAGDADVRGVEASVEATREELTGHATLALTRGEAADGTPLSRIPPANGAMELRWRRASAYGAVGLRWAMAQTRLAASDLGDPRIPAGGTRGYAVADLRAGVRVTTEVRLAAVLENLFDAAYRYHGSTCIVWYCSRTATTQACPAIYMRGV